MFREFSSLNKRDLVEYVCSIFGENVYSFSRVVLPDEVMISVTRHIERDGVSSWECINASIGPDVVKARIHYLDGLYVVEAGDENEFRRLINSAFHPEDSVFAGGVRVPEGTVEYFYDDALHDVYLRGDDVLVGISLVWRGKFLVPKKMVVAAWDEWIESIADPLMRRLLYEKGVVMNVPTELLVRGAPSQYYVSFIF